MNKPLQRDQSATSRRCAAMERPGTGVLGVAVVAIVFCIGCRTGTDFYNSQGVRMFQTGNQPAALQQFQQAVATNPTNPDAYYNLAATLHRLGTQTNNQEMLRQAEGVYNQCRDLNEN